MNNVWFETLVIILSAMLALFLLLSILLLVKFIQITKQIKKVTDKAEETVDKAEEVASFFKNSATPIAIIKLIANISEKFSATSDKFNKKRKKSK